VAKECELVSFGSSDGSSDVSSKIIIVGAGMAGTTLAAVLGQQGRRVILVDPRSSCPRVFKAEKVDQEPVRLLRKFGLLQHLIPHSRRWSEVHAGYDGRIFKTLRTEQYGITYADMVNALRANLPPVVDYRCDSVEHIANSGQLQRVKLRSGGELTSRLVVLTSGVSGGLLAGLNLRRRVLQKDQCVVLGFDVAASEEQPFDFDSVVYYSANPSTCISYLTFFKVRNTMRANLFVYRSAYDPWIREFIREPEQMLRCHLPELSRVTGQFHVTSKVESGNVDLYSVEGNPQPGVVLVGDAFQTACPATGLGVSKILTDVDVLSTCIPRWLATPGMGTDKLGDFYNHPSKLAADSLALQRAHHDRSLAVDPSLRWRIHRSLVHLKWQLSGRTQAPPRRSRFHAVRGTVFNKLL
jgi:2-polyprenyl-6-methoxyphenol hydroxylase-like FAD-dependent oxidoreductase